MAVDRKQFINTVDKGIKADKEYKKFYVNIRVDGKIFQKVLDYSNKDWDKRTRISKAKLEVVELKEKQLNSGLNFNENSTLDQLKDIYFEHHSSKIEWSKELQNMYRLHIQPSLGSKKIKDIKKVHIDSIRVSMEQSGHSKQTANGCSPRTIKKVLLQTLKPILKYAVDNRIIAILPPFELPPSSKKTKRVVKNASEKFATLYNIIIDLYKEDPFYRALFLFALFGRRWNEIRTIEWSDIDLINCTYTIRAENNKISEDQTYSIPPIILLALSEIKDDHIGLVFKSPVTQLALCTPKKQLAKIKEKADIPELTMHYFRHILVSAMGEMGTANTVLSASLGHTNLQTVNDFYLSANHTKASAEANQTIAKLLENKGKNS